ncbi:MAG: NAD(P)/FAD-dependent oxidoreductase [Hyphomonadaceae bacterium]
MTNSNIAILGGGMAGFGAAHQCHQAGVRPTLYEARPAIGGHTSTHVYDDGFVFDEGPHISFTADTRIQALFAQSLGGEFERLKAYVDNYWQGHWIKHPAQVNLYGLPPELVAACIRDFIAASHAPTPPIAHYEDWLLAAFGETFARTFPIEYTKKYHTTEAKNLTTDWLGPRLYRPTIEEVLIGALKPEALDVHYVDHFRYPKSGGFVRYLDQFLPMADVRPGHRVSQIDARARTLTFANGAQAGYGALVSSLPLPVLVRLIKDAPADVRAAAAKLSCSQVVLVNVGLNRPVETRANWTYFYDEDYVFARLSYPSGFSQSLVPPGCGSIQAEIYFSEKWKPMTGKPEDWIEPAISDLIRCGLVQDRSEIVHKSVIFAPFANVIFDHDRPAALDAVHGFLNDVGVAYCGRYGDWGYIWTDQAFMSGERAARVALSGGGAP